jgi:hypothetical protein
MNEETLFAAYKHTEDKYDEELAVWRIEDREHASKCAIESCMTMIGDPRRVICRYHQGKRQRGEI